MRELAQADFSNHGLSLLNEIPQIPTSIFIRGTDPSKHTPLLAVIGSRQYTSYGKAVVDHLIGGLAGYNVGIVSGLAIGMDGLAHEAALRHNLYTLAVPGGGLDDSVIYPARHKRLAREILERGGTLLSEYQPTQRAATWTFPRRNRIVCGLCVGTLVIEAGAKSGSLITARMTVDYNRELMVVPGDIFSPVSQGTNQFLKLGATPITTAQDIIDLLALTTTTTPTLPFDTSALSAEELQVLRLLQTPIAPDDLLRACELQTHTTSAILMQLELKGCIKQIDGVYHNLTNL